MADERLQVASRSSEGGSCPGCGQAVDSSRCAWCGVAMSPNGYIVEKVIARGPHGRVYLARDAEGRPVALKELQFAQVPTTQEIDAFEREAQTLAQLSHPRIPRFLRSFTEGSGVGLRLYLAAEHVAGEPLSARIARGPLGESEARHIAKQVLEVLAFLHGQRPALVHRDVKPDNLILRPDGTVALVDFGTARALSGTRTFGSTLVGTFGYMPPEQLGGTVDPSSDLYALGATLLHALTGKPPGDLVRPDLTLTLPADVPARMRPLLSSLLERDPKLRLRSARAALDVLEGRVAPVQKTQPARMGAVLATVAVISLLTAALSFWTMARRAGTVATAPIAVVDTSGLPYGSDAAKRWFAKQKPRCNALEVTQAIHQSPPPPGWDGAGYAASCYALAGRVDDARRALSQVDPRAQPNAAAILFELGHPIADSGDDVSAAQLMNLVLEFWPQNYQARYHAGMSDYALGHTEQARQNLERFLREYQKDDGFTHAAREVLARIQRGQAPDGVRRGPRE